MGHGVAGGIGEGRRVGDEIDIVETEGGVGFVVRAYSRVSGGAWAIAIFGVSFRL